MKSNVAKARYVETDDYLKMVASMIRKAGERVGKADPAQLAALDTLRLDLEQASREAVRAMRGTGITWDSIGEAMGVSRQAVIKRWAKFCH